jgi:response regulator RpfG family c-di-GMP phosphodiesterase
MSVQETITFVTAILSSLIMVFTLINRFLWSKEYKDAKEEIIRKKDEQIKIEKSKLESLRENLNSQIETFKIQINWMQSLKLDDIKNFYENKIDILNAEMSVKVLLIEEKDNLICELQEKQNKYQRLFATSDKYNQIDKKFIQAWADIIDVWEKLPIGTTVKSTDLAINFAEFIEMDENEIGDLVIGGLLHDIGKISIPDSLLTKPSKLTKQEFDIIKEHPKIGSEILERINSLKKYSKFPLFHHERWDGSGYPSGLSGDDIPKIIQVFSLCDTYMSLLRERPYRNAYKKSEVIGYLVNSKGKSYSPELTDKFINFINSRSI